MYYYKGSCISQVLILTLLYHHQDYVVNNYSKLKHCDKSSFFVPDSLTQCNELTMKSLEYDMKLYFMSSLLLNNRNHNCYIRFLILLSGDISLNPGPPVNLTQINNDWKIFEQRGFHMAHININSLLPKIDELRAIAY